MVHFSKIRVTISVVTHLGAWLFSTGLRQQAAAVMIISLVGSSFSSVKVVCTVSRKAFQRKKTHDMNISIYRHVSIGHITLLY